ncbi:NYN domain-containing protein [Massilia sp. YIM B04103]|uniref:NYN domain-containing protein n=1 Tax=Massilia sp. YIM B04103 TaxID=2963106 RepID=UPI00210B5B93|nr:NYN domain-containing protein [Massilia sp. YIM B04103]
MPANEKSARKTTVYVDGYNLYYGRLRGTPYKWLDLVQLFDTMLAQRDQNESLEMVRFFTAPALANFASHGRASVEAQSAYHRALKARHPDRFDLIYGAHAYDKSGTLLPCFVTGQPYNRANRTRVWKLEEKKTDVNLALGMYRDACRRAVSRMILVSNDSDAEPALAAIREDFPDIMLGLIVPIRPSISDRPIHRRTSGSLAKFADWIVPSLPDHQLLQAQLPPIVPARKKPIHKPVHW